MQTTIAPPPNPDLTSPQAAYDASSAKASELRQQLEGLVDQRGDVIREIGQLSSSQLTGAQKTGLDERLTRLDKRIAGLDEEIAQADAQVVTAAAVPGAVVPQVPVNRGGGDEGEAFFGGASMMLAGVLVWSLIRRKFWRRGKRKAAAAGQAALPGEVTARMERLENIAEATALEVERIGEGQRFVTKLLSETRPVGAKDRVS